MTGGLTLHKPCLRRQQMLSAQADIALRRGKFICPNVKYTQRKSGGESH